VDIHSRLAAGLLQKGLAVPILFHRARGALPA
jgi:hypothetical protein